MSELDYHVVDVFTERSYAGNPLAVVLDADELSAPQMQAIAREFNLSETTFVQTPTADATYRVRIFTPATELPFAGHPSVGTAWLLAKLGRIPARDVVQECGAGSLPIAVSERGATLTGGVATASEPLAAAQFVAALGLREDDLVGTPVRRCGAGLEFPYVHVSDDALGRVRVDLQLLAEVARVGIYVFSFDGGHVHARLFAGGVGVAEDPATGSAALGLGVFLVASGLLPGDATSSYDVTQGAEIGRPSALACAVEAAGGQVVRVTVSGGVAPVARGRITVPA